MDAYLDNRWYALQVKSGRELQVIALLNAKGYNSLCPLRFVAGNPGRALFRGYVFCRYDRQIGFPMIKTSGVIRVVGYGNQAVPIADHEMNALRRITDAGLYPEAWANTRSAGRRIVVEKGPLAGIIGEFVYRKNSGRLIVTISLLQRSVAVEIEADWVRDTLMQPSYLRLCAAPVLSLS